jgi:hypothetical protein
MIDKENKVSDEEQELSDDSSEDSEIEFEEAENPIDNWIVVFESAETMEVELVEARFDDEGIEYYTHNKQELRNNVGLGTSWVYTSGNPMIIFVRPENEEKARLLIEEDRSKLLDDPNLDFGTPEEP